MAAAMKTSKRKTKTASKLAAPEISETLAHGAVASDALTSSALTLASHCTIKDAAALKLDLCAIAHEEAAVTIDVAGVERIDTSTMQLLCAFVHDRMERKHKVLFRGESQGWREAVRLLGVAELLGLHEAGEEVRA